MKNSCLGLIGWINGHNFEHIYDVDKRPVKAEEFQKMTNQVKKYNFWNTLNEIDASTIPIENVTKVYKHSICKRCGLKIKDETQLI